MKSFKTLKDSAWQANLLLPKYGLVQFTFGNVSAFDKHHSVYAIKPSGVPYDELRMDDMVIVDLEDRVVEGKLNPSSDSRTHTVLYREFPDMGGICHTHSCYATAWAQSRRSIPVYGTTHADHLPCEIPCTRIMTKKQIQTEYEIETGNQIVRLIRNPKYSRIEMVLVACHGPFTWGESAEKAVNNSVILEELAKISLLSEILNPDIKPISYDLIQKHFSRKHGENAYYGQNTRKAE